MTSTDPRFDGWMDSDGNGSGRWKEEDGEEASVTEGPIMGRRWHGIVR